MRILSGRAWVIAAAATIAGCGVKPAATGYQVQQFEPGLCRIGLERCQGIYGYGSLDCIDRYRYCLTVLGPRSGYAPPSQRGFPPAPPPPAYTPPGPGEDVYFQRAEPTGQQPPQPPQQQPQQPTWPFRR